MVSGPTEATELGLGRSPTVPRRLGPAPQLPSLKNGFAVGMTSNNTPQRRASLDAGGPVPRRASVLRLFLQTPSKGSEPSKGRERGQAGEAGRWLVCPEVRGVRKGEMGRVSASVGLSWSRQGLGATPEACGSLAKPTGLAGGWGWGSVGKIFQAGRSYKAPEVATAPCLRDSQERWQQAGDGGKDGVCCSMKLKISSIC